MPSPAGLIAGYAQDLRIAAKRARSPPAVLERPEAMLFATGTVNEESSLCTRVNPDQ